MRLVKYFFYVSVLCVLTLNLQAAEWESSGNVKTSGGELHYRIAGSGKPLVLLHGYSGYGGQWQPFLPEFLEEYKVIAIDLPGHGQSSKLTGSFVIADAARDVWQLLDQLGEGQIQGIGYSAGGMTLLQMALQQPSRVQSMILAASAVSVSGESARTPFEQLPEAYQQDLLHNHQGDMEKIRAMLGAIFEGGMTASALVSLNTRTLLVAGDRDTSFPLPVLLETYAALPNARLWIVPDLDHALFWPWGGSERLAAQFPAEALRFFRNVKGK